MSTELVICKAIRYSIDRVMDHVPIYIFGDETDGALSHIELSAAVVFNWAGGAQVFQARSTRLCTLSASIVVEKSGMDSELLGRIIDDVRKGVEGQWQEVTNVVNGNRLNRYYNLFTPDGSVTGVTSLPKQTQHDTGEGLIGEAPVFTVFMQWVFYIWTN